MSVGIAHSPSVTETIFVGIAAAFTLGFVCVATDLCSGLPLNLGGDSATIRYVLFPETIEDEGDIAVEAHAANPATQEEIWWTFSPTFGIADERTRGMAHARLASVDATLRWTNSALASGDLELGFSCGTWAERTTGGALPTGLAQGERTVAATFEAPDESDCDAPALAAVVDSVTGSLTARASGVFHLEGGVQEPTVQ